MSTKSKEKSAVDQMEDNILRHDDEHLDMATRYELACIENTAYRKEKEAREELKNDSVSSRLTQSYNANHANIKRCIRDILSDDLAFPHHAPRNAQKLRDLLHNEYELVDQHLIKKRTNVLAEDELTIARAAKRQKKMLSNDEED
jgi:hypothetical protein